MHPRAAELVRTLDLAPHREGGFFREIFRSPSTVEPGDGRPRRSALTTIFFLLVEGQASRWHAVRSEEVWHLYEGSLELFVAPPDAARVERRRLGPVDGRQRPTHTVSTDWWQAARPLGPYALAGCTVAPGFEYEDFRTLAGDSAAARALALAAPDLASLL